jgi:hypothetical protein
MVPTTLRGREPAASPVPSGPPASLLAEIDAAFERSGELFAGELELHFACDAFTARVSGELRVPGGAACEWLSATEALAIACGDFRLSA